MGGGFSSRVFLVALGPSREHWPEPLGQLVDSGRVGIEATDSVHEAAARLAGGGDERARGLLVDPQILTANDVKALGVISRHVQVPMMMLPMTAGASPCAKEALSQGVMAWADAMAELGALAREGKVEETAEVSFGKDREIAADNAERPRTGVDERKAVTSDVAARYDQMGSEPLVSEQEMQALLETE